MITKFIEVIFSLFLRKTRVQIDPDHLPGLRAPKPMPFRPPLAREQLQQEGETLSDTYERFIESRVKGSTKRKSDWNFW